MRAAGHAIITGAGLLAVRGVAYNVHRKPGRPDSLRIEYRVAGYQFPSVSEWLCCWHGGTTGALAWQEYRRRLVPGAPAHFPRSAAEAVAAASLQLRKPSHIRITRRGEFIHAVPLFEQRAIA